MRGAVSLRDQDLSSFTVALEGLNVGLRESGAILTVESTNTIGMTIRLSLQDDACIDCIVGPDLLYSIVETAVIEAGWHSPVTIIDPRNG